MYDLAILSVMLRSNIQFSANCTTIHTYSTYKSDRYEYVRICVSFISVIFDNYMYDTKGWRECLDFATLHVSQSNLNFFALSLVFIANCVIAKNHRFQLSTFYIVVGGLLQSESITLPIYSTKVKGHNWAFTDWILCKSYTLNVTLYIHNTDRLSLHFQFP